MCTLVYRKVPCAKYRWFFLFLFAYRWTHSCSTLRRPRSWLSPKEWLCYFCTFPHIISQGLREFKCDLLGNDKCQSLQCLLNEIIYTNHFTIAHCIFHRQILSLKWNLDFKKREGFFFTSLKNDFVKNVTTKFTVLVWWFITIYVFWKRQGYFRSTLVLQIKDLRLWEVSNLDKVS